MLSPFHTWSKEELWSYAEQKLPNIKDIFENYVVFLKINNRIDAFITITSDCNKIKEKMIKFHLYSSIKNKIFTLYCNLDTKEMYVRNELNESKRLTTYSEKKYISSVNDLHTLLFQTISLI